MHKVEVFVRAIDEAFGVRLLTVINGSRLDTEFEGPRAILFVSATDTYHIIIPLGSSDELHIGTSADAWIVDDTDEHFADRKRRAGQGIPGWGLLAARCWYRCAVRQNCRGE